MAETNLQWPSPSRAVHVKDRDGVTCRAAVIVSVIGEPGPNTDVELFVYPSWRDISADPPVPPFDGRERIHRDEWHWPEYVGPMAEGRPSEGVTDRVG